METDNSYVQKSVEHTILANMYVGYCSSVFLIKIGIGKQAPNCFMWYRLTANSQKWTCSGTHHISLYDRIHWITVCCWMAAPHLHFGIMVSLQGSSLGQFFEQYLEPIKLNDVHVCKTFHIIHLHSCYKLLVAEIYMFRICGHRLTGIQRIWVTLGR